MIIGRLRPILPYFVFALILAVLPYIFDATPFFTVSTAVQMAIMSIATLGLVLLMGQAGQISIGQAAFFGIGAFSSAILTTRWEIAPIWACLVGMVIAGVIAWVVGLAIFRVRGHYLALATIAFGLSLSYLARQIEITGGASGILGIPSIEIGALTLFDDLSFYYLAATILLICLILTHNLTRSMFGRSLLAIGDSEIAADSVGINTAKQKRGIFVIAAVLAALAGSLQAHWVTFIDYHALDLMLSIEILIMAAVGGLVTVWGAPVGAFIVIALSRAAKETIPSLFPNVGGQYEIVVYGIALIIVLLYLPNGVAGTVRDVFAGRSRDASQQPKEPA